MIILILLAVSAAGGVALASGALRDMGGLGASRVGIWLVALLLLVNFLLLWGYYVAFELLWDGQTPGKRAIGLRVLRDSGHPLGFLDSLIRNLLRLVDFLPLYYGIGVLTMLIDARWRRLGDLAAGTIVVKERSDLRATDLLAGDYAAPDDAAGPAVLGAERLTDREYALLREYLLRRAGLGDGPRAALAGELVAMVAARLKLEAPSEPAEAEALLKRVAATYRAYHAARWPEPAGG